MLFYFSTFILGDARVQPRPTPENLVVSRWGAGQQRYITFVEVCVLVVIVVVGLASKYVQIRGVLFFNFWVFLQKSILAIFHSENDVPQWWCEW